MSVYTDPPSGGAARPDHPAGDDNWWETAGATESHASNADVAGANSGAGALRPGTAAASILARAFRNRPAQTAEDNAAAAAGKKPCGVEKLLRSIAADYGTHALVLEALIEILVKKGLVTEDEFEELLGDIDARDGRLDGTLGDPNYQLGDGI